MLIVSDFQGFSTVAENIDSLYDTITHDLEVLKSQYITV